jgi:hypothetical protein
MIDMNPCIDHFETIIGYAHNENPKIEIVRTPLLLFVLSMSAWSLLDMFIDMSRLFIDKHDLTMAQELVRCLQCKNAALFPLSVGRDVFQ